MKDLYAILGVPENADADTIKKAYRKLAKQNHPDATGGDKKKTERFKEVGDAYAVLSDAKKRQEYDRLRQAPVGADGMPQGFDADAFSQIFGDYRGGDAADPAVGEARRRDSATSATFSRRSSAVAGMRARPGGAAGAATCKAPSRSAFARRLSVLGARCARVRDRAWRSTCRPGSKAALACACPDKAARPRAVDGQAISTST
jgi:curved DNA-binding protein CbpA